MPTTHRLTSIALLAVASLLSVSCNSEPASGQSRPLRLLFIGNSYTYTNELPTLVGALADSAGWHDLHIESVTLPGVSLEDHWNDGRALARLASGHWDIVVLQQGPSSQPDSRVLLLEYATRFTEEIRKAGGRPAFYSVWPERSRPQDYDGARDSYTIAADSLGGMLFPASEAWRAAWRRDATLALYSPDDLHPSQLGSYLVGLVMVGELTGQSPLELPGGVRVDGSGGYTFAPPPGVARMLREAAAEAITNFGRR